MFELSMALNEKEKFKLGNIHLTKCVFDECQHNSYFFEFVKESIRRHSTCDWGDVNEEDKMENDYSIDKHLRVFSAYNHPGSGLKIWVITESDRSATTVLYPDEY